MNSVQIIGNLTRDPELRSLTSGTQVCSMRVAVNGRRRDGERWVIKPNFFDVVVFGKQGAACAEHLSKGRRIAVTGRLDYQEWKSDKDGATRSRVEIVAIEVDFLSPAPQGEAQESQPAEEAAPDSAPASTEGASRRSRTKETAGAAS